MTDVEFDKVLFNKDFFSSPALNFKKVNNTRARREVSLYIHGNWSEGF